MYQCINPKSFHSRMTLNKMFFVFAGSLVSYPAASDSVEAKLKGKSWFFFPNCAY